MSEKTATKRAPVVAIMGHIDHGKSTLLSYIRNMEEARSKELNEAGGITQHISAYEVEHTTSEGTVEKITFLDTPGHEAFSGHRSRGAKVADIAILVVSGEDGVKPQTLEALKSIQAGNVPFIVAITKIDKPSANVEQTKQSLAENNIFVEGYGGDVPIVSVSGKTGVGIKELLDLITLSADLQNLTGDPDALASGQIIESNLDPKTGISATCIIKDGSLRKGMFVACEGAVTPVRVLQDWTGRNISEASFSMPVKIIGWNNMPKVGSIFKTFTAKSDAEDFSRIGTGNTKHEIREEKESEIKNFPLVIKADTSGSLEAITFQIDKLASDKFSGKIVPWIIHSGIGAISESDVRVAIGRERAVVLGFNVKVDAPAKTLAERDHVLIATFTVIYALSEWLEAQLTEHTPTIEVEEMTGEAKVLKTFSKVKDKQIIGCRMETGTISVGEQVKIMRREALIGSGKVRELQMQKTKVSSVEAVKECGAMVEAKIEIVPGDKLQAFTLVKR